jgi:amino acid transporter
VEEQVVLRSKEVEKAVEKGRHGAGIKAKLPIALVAAATLLVCAIFSIVGISLTGGFGAIGLGIMIGAWLALGIASTAVDAAFAKPERAIALWEKVMAMTKQPESEGLAENPDMPGAPASGATERWLLPGQEN